LRRRSWPIDEFRSLQKSGDPQRRGIQFESLVARQFREAYVKVQANPGVARPRQTDFLAMNSRDRYLVEMKWKQKAADINDVDSLFSRLDRTPGSVVGVLVSISGFSKNAIERVESRRDRPVLLVTGAEIERILQRGSLTRLLRRKQDHLLVEGRALLTQEQPERPGIRSVAQGQLPGSNRVVVHPDGHRTTTLSCAGDFGSFVFVQEVPDIDWVTATGHGVNLDLPLSSVEDESQLLDLLHELAQMGLISSSAAWSIAQSDVNWHGSGGQRFFEAVAVWRDRYQQLDSVHHTEQVIYHDVCEGGFYTLTADISASERRYVSHGNISFQLIGTPLDTEPVRHLCETLEADEPIYFRPRNSRSVSTHHLSSTDRLVLQPVAFLVEEDDEDPQENWVVAVVAQNPYRRQPWGSQTAAPEWWPPQLLGSELLICSLRSQHPLATAIPSYFLSSCELAETSDAAVVRPIADWDR
jgi:hypothetical protein